MDKSKTQSSNENKVNNQQQSNNEDNGYSWTTYLYPIAIFIVINIAMNFIKGGGTNPNAVLLINVMSNNTYYDINFYLSDEPSISSKASPIYTLKDLKYCYPTDKEINLQTKNNINISSSYNISKILKMKNKKKASIYMVAEIAFHNMQEYKYLLQKYSVPRSAFYQAVNVLEYVDDLSFFSSSADLDTPTVPKPAPVEVDNKTNAIPNLYYKPVLSFYISKTAQKEDITKFQMLRQLKADFFMNLDDMTYFPVMNFNDFWTENSEYVPINRTEINYFNFTISHSYLNSYLYTMMLNIKEQFSQSILHKTAKDVLVQLLKYNSISYLVILFSVQILHMIFSSLDFMTNISYYNNLKKLDGVYTKYIFFNLFYIATAALYVFKNGADYMTKIMLLKDLVFQIWKLRKIFDIKFSKKFPFVSLEYKMDFVVPKSKDYENEAISIMVKFLLIPVGVGYFIYRAYYFYSSETSLFNFIIEYIFFLFGVFGFILMTPQIYLNYKLKSVDHFPFKIMIFKFLDTIVDDLEIFALKSPTLYRIFCFKDDVIFVIYLYQLFKYKDNRLVDVAKRIEQEEKEKEAAKDKKDN